MLAPFLLLAPLQALEPVTWQAQRAAALELRAPEATLAALDAWREHVLPAADERRWEEIPWLATFAEGVRRADAERKPLLFWAMNGHPLGCT